MKKIILILMGLFIGSISYAQNKNLTINFDTVGRVLIFYGSVDVTDSIIILSGDPNSFEIVFPAIPSTALVANSTIFGLWITIEKINISEVPGTQNYFCWGTFCYDSSIHISQPYFIGAFWGSNSFSAHYEPNGYIGITKIKYYFYPSQNVQPSFIELWFDVSVGIKENLEKEIKIYPNPTTDYLCFNRRYKSIKMYNVMGKLIYEGRNQEKVSLINYPNGIYNIILDNNLKTKVIKQ